MKSSSQWMKRSEAAQLIFLVTLLVHLFVIVLFFSVVILNSRELYYLNKDFERYTAKKANVVGHYSGLARNLSGTEIAIDGKPFSLPSIIIADSCEVWFNDNNTKYLFVKKDTETKSEFYLRYKKQYYKLIFNIFALLLICSALDFLNFKYVKPITRDEKGIRMKGWQVLLLLLFVVTLFYGFMRVCVFFFD